MDFGRAFTYLSDDKEWINKVLIGTAISLVPILNFAAGGYFLEVIQRVAQQKETPLPEWSDLGNKWVKGLLFFSILVLYYLPSIVIGLIGVATVILAAAQSGGSEEAVPAALFSMLVFILLAAIWMLLVILIVPAVAIQYALNGNFGAAFKLGNIFGLIRKDIGGYGIALVIVFISGLLVGVAAAVPIIGGLVALAAGFYVSLVRAHAYGQLAEVKEQESIPSPEIGQ